MPIWYYANGRSYKSNEIRCLTVEFYALLGCSSRFMYAAVLVSAFECARDVRGNPLECFLTLMTRMSMWVNSICFMSIVKKRSLI